MVWVQKGPFFQVLFFRKYTPRKCLLRYSKTKKRLSRLQKQEVQKLEKLTFFQRETHGFGPKMAIFPTFFFTQCRPVKCLFRYSRTKKRFFRLQKQEGKTLEKLKFFQRG